MNKSGIHSIREIIVIYTMVFYGFHGFQKSMEICTNLPSSLAHHPHQAEKLTTPTIKNVMVTVWSNKHENLTTPTIKNVMVTVWSNKHEKSDYPHDKKCHGYGLVK